MMDKADLEALIELARPNFEGDKLGRCRGYETPEGADGECGLATDLFWDIVCDLVPEIRAAEVHFVPDDTWQNRRPRWGLYENTPLFSYNHAPHPWYRKGCKHMGHVVLAVGDWLVDWTARQFDPEAPFPLVFSYRDVLKAAEPQSQSTA